MFHKLINCQAIVVVFVSVSVPVVLRNPLSLVDFIDGPTISGCKDALHRIIQLLAPAHTKDFAVIKNHR